MFILEALATTSLKNDPQIESNKLIPVKYHARKLSNQEIEHQKQQKTVHKVFCLCR